ncbi:uncharacterized protein V1518DRAFT_427750 [Limtongia smithiae]|uniref:uncharacterized protein n=1 Tax=Limtongia smithiae TaxID=1125753 RepID=UPI0034CD846A
MQTVTSLSGGGPASFSAFQYDNRDCHELDFGATDQCFYPSYQLSEYHLAANPPSPTSQPQSTERERQFYFDDHGQFAQPKLLDYDISNSHDLYSRNPAAVAYSSTSWHHGAAAMGPSSSSAWNSTNADEDVRSSRSSDLLSPESWISPATDRSESIASSVSSSNDESSRRSTISSTSSAGSQGRFSASNNKEMTAAEYYSEYVKKEGYPGFSTDVAFKANEASPLSMMPGSPLAARIPSTSLSTLARNQSLSLILNDFSDNTENLAVPAIISPGMLSESVKSTEHSKSSISIGVATPLPTMFISETVPLSISSEEKPSFVDGKSTRRQGHNRTYRCRHCGSFFASSATLKTHILDLPDKSLSQRPFKCPELGCDWNVIGFHRNNDCSRHFRQVHGVREYVCRWQGARECRTHRFVTAWLRNRHERTVHAGEVGTQNEDLPDDDVETVQSMHSIIPTAPTKRSSVDVLDSFKNPKVKRNKSY